MKATAKTRQIHIDIVQAAQQGGDAAIEELIAALRALPTANSTRRYVRLGMPELEPEVLVQEYLLGAYQYLPHVKLDIGDPLLHLAWRGIRATSQYYRTILRKDHAKQCPICGAEWSATSRLRYCLHCKVETELELVLGIAPMPVDDDDDFLDIPDPASPLNPDIEVLLARIITTLDREGSRLGTLLRLMLRYDLYPRCGKNYCGELAKLMGLSPAGVSYWTRQLRKRIHQFCEDEAWLLD